ncbi:hypothetical protein HAX54_025424, partial [Datura stramonium]|nr:hypothetical protein [Datura stramonium]
LGAIRVSRSHVPVWDARVVTVILATYATSITTWAEFGLLEGSSLPESSPCIITELPTPITRSCGSNMYSS